MSRRWERLLLIFSLAVNAAFVSLAAVHLRSSEPAPAQIERPQARFSPRWQRRRAFILGHRLGLDPAQREAIHARLATMGPDFAAAKEEMAQARQEFFRALARNDVHAARIARARLSVVQARIDSLSAEAMLREIEHLSPDQREGYLRMMARPMPWDRPPSAHPPPPPPPPPD